MRIFYCILAVCPFALGTFFAAFNLTVGWDNFTAGERTDSSYMLSGFDHPVIGILCFLVILAAGTGLFFLGKVIIDKTSSANICGTVSSKQNNLITASSKQDDLRTAQLNQCRKADTVFAVLYVLAVTVIVRLIFVILYGNEIEPFSDFANSWLNAKGADYLLEHYKFFPAYLNYAVFERIITHFDRQYIIVVISSVLLNGLSAAGIYLFAAEILRTAHGFAVETGEGPAVEKNSNFVTGIVKGNSGSISLKKGGKLINYIPLLAALIFALDPSSVLYSLVGNPEHLTVCCNIFVLLFVVKAMRILLSVKGMQESYGIDYYVTDDGAQKVDRWGCYFKPWLMLAFAGILAGVGNSMKSFFPIMVVAFVITAVFYFVSGYSKWYGGGNRKTEAAGKRTKVAGRRNTRTLIQLLTFVAAFIIVFAAEYVTNAGILKLTENVFDIETSSGDTLPHFVLVGLSREGEGQVNGSELSRYFITMREDGVPYDEAYAKAVEAFKEDWNGHLYEIPSFILKKCIWEWQADDTPHWYFSYSMGLDSYAGDYSTLQGKVYNFIEEYGSYIGELFYLALMLGGLIASIGLVRSKGSLNTESANIPLLLSNLMIEGFFCLILLSEAQSRYKHLILPFICILVAMNAGLYSKKTLSHFSGK